MTSKELVKKSKFLARHLRHAPEDLGLTLQLGGWVAVSELLEACARAGFPMSREQLDQVVAAPFLVFGQLHPVRILAAALGDLAGVRDELTERKELQDAQVTVPHGSSFLVRNSDGECILI